MGALSAAESHLQFHQPNVVDGGTGRLNWNGKVVVTNGRDI
jgi:hypothetical protein